MKPRLSHRHETGMTLFEVGVVIAILLILGAVLLPNLVGPSRSRRIAMRLNCVNNLKQVDLAYRIWEGDHGDISPMEISVTNGGGMEMVATGNVVQAFMVMSNELSTPKILYCPADAGRAWAPTFSGLSNSNISYFVGVDVTNDTNPQMFISGDSNFEVGGLPVKSGLLSLSTNHPVTWTATRHIRLGNIGLADGSVLVTTPSGPSGLRMYFVETGLATNRLAIP